MDRDQIVAELEKRADSVIDVIAERVRSDVAEIAEVIGDADEFRDQLVQGAREFFESLRGDDRTARFIDIGRERAEFGEDLEPLLRSVRLATIGVVEELNRIVDAVGQDGETSASALALTIDLLRHADAISTRASDAYAEATRTLEIGRVHQAQRRMQQLRRGDVESSHDRRHTVFSLISAAPHSQVVDSLVRTVSSRTSGGLAAIVIADDLICAAPSPSPSDDRRLARDLLADVGTRTVVVAAAERVADIELALQEVLRISSCVRARPELVGVVGLDDVLVTAAVEAWGERTTRRLAEIAGPLIDHEAEHRAPLSSTIRQLGTLGSIAAVARRGGVHRNTISWRLRRIHELTGFDPTLPNDLLVLSAAVAAQSAIGDSHPASSLIS